MSNRGKLVHPLFLLSVATLVLNDWVLKDLFHNYLTGKLSDLAGLFALPFFLSCIFSKHLKAVHFLVAISFILWKSNLSQPLIDLFHSVNIPIDRVVDATDLIALISLPASYMVWKRCRDVAVKPVLANGIMLVSAVAFMATSLPRHYVRFISIDKNYNFNCSKRELVSRFNSVQMRYVNDINKYSQRINFDSESNVFYLDDEYTKTRDTVALILDYEKIKDTDTITYKTSFAEIMIMGNDDTSALKLVSIYGYFYGRRKIKREEAIRHFEKGVVKPIRKFGKKLY